MQFPPLGFHALSMIRTNTLIYNPSITAVHPLFSDINPWDVDNHEYIMPIPLPCTATALRDTLCAHTFKNRQIHECPPHPRGQEISGAE